MSNAEWTVSCSLSITIDPRRTDFNGLVAAIQAAAGPACGELLGRAMREVERRAQQQEPGRWENRGPQTRRLRLL